MELSTFNNTAGEGLVTFQAWQTHGPEYEQDHSRWYCHLLVNGERIFEYGCPCGTCGIVFRKVGSTKHQLSDPEAVQIVGDLRRIPSSADLERLARVLEPGTYHPIVIEGNVLQIEAGATNDYFATDVVRLFGFEPPEYKEPAGPRTPYYKFGFEGELDGTGSALVTAVLMPLHDPSQLNRERVEFWKQKHRAGATLTAFAVSVVDRQSPAVLRGDLTYKYDEQFLFANCVLDGHHRIQAAAELGTPVRVLSFVSSQFSLVEESNDLTAVLANYVIR